MENMTSTQAQGGANTKARGTHTPGPWTPHSFSHGLKDVPIRADNGRNVANVSNCDGRELVANSRLIAAAPELLEALTRIAEELDTEFDSMEKHIAVKIARAAIAKATQS
jgi:hypothetical protein